MQGWQGLGILGKWHKKPKIKGVQRQEGKYIEMGKRG